MVLCTGGMSVDPDDRTPLAIKNTGAEIVTYGAPVLPGAMFLLSYYGEKKKDQSLVFRDALCMRNGLFLIWFCHGSWLERF